MASETQSLTAWTQAALSSLYTLPPDTDAQAFTSSFDNVFAQTATVSTNDESVPRDEVREKIAKRRGPMSSAAHVEWKECSSVPKDASRPDDAGTVTGEYVVTRSMKWRVRGAPAQTQMFVSVEATVEQDESATTEDRRRIIHLVEKVEDKSVPIHLPHVRHTDDDNKQKSLADLD